MSPQEAILKLAVCIRDLTCMMGAGGDKWFEERLTLIHDDAREIIERLDSN